MRRAPPGSIGFENTYTMSPTPPAGSLFRRAPIPLTEMMYRFRAPELSAQFMIAPLYIPVSSHPCPKFKKPFCCDNVLSQNEASRGRENVHWETQGHLELATGGTTTVNRALSAKTSSPRLPARVCSPFSVS